MDETKNTGVKAVIQKLDHMVSRLFNALTILSVIAVCVVIIICVVDVVGSKLFSHPFAPAYELTQMLSVPLVFFTVGSVQMGRGMMRIDLIAGKLPKIVRKICDVLGNLLGIVVCAFLTYRSLIYAVDTLYANHVKTTGNIKLVQWPFCIILVIGLAMLTIAYVFTTFRSILGYAVLPDLSPEELMAADKKAKTPEEALENIYPDVQQDAQLGAGHPGMGSVIRHKADEAAQNGADQKEEGGDEK